jgi:hypothetical protein
MWRHALTRTYDDTLLGCFFSRGRLCQERTETFLQREEGEKMLLVLSSRRERDNPERTSPHMYAFEKKKRTGLTESAGGRERESL